MKLKKVFERKEKKYLMRQDQFEAFFSELQNFMAVDEYGLHTIQSLYFDTKDYQFIKRSVEKPIYKEKFRIRSYGYADCDHTLYVEIKKKVNGIVYKRRLPLNYQEFMTWKLSQRFPACLTQNQIGQEIQWLFLLHPDLSPKVLISYDRLSLSDANDENFRVTFD
ncbi:MAG TPA: polyphosphate polymerase domain-containing protein [Tetragenococcus sp.]|nr:polyphosphate polymerase domain-containing protein [Tetragenococcus sp.]